MKALSYWAVCHPKKTWVLLAVIQTIIGVLVFEYGVLLALEGIALPPVLIYLGIAICILASVFYPVRRSASKFWKWSYGRQKLMDFGLVFSGLLMMCTWTNREVFQTELTDNSMMAIQVVLLEKPEPSVENSFWQNIKHVGPRQAIQIELRKQVIKRVQKDQEKQKAPLSIWWIVLIIIFGSVLSAIIACALACNGMGSWAALVLFGGIAYFTVGGLMWIKSRKAANANLKGQSLTENKLE